MLFPTSPCILDTGILIHYIRAGVLGQWIESNYRLRTASDPSFISAVTVGEIRSFGTQQNWGRKKRDFLDHFLDDLYIVAIEYELIYQAYEDIDVYSRNNGYKMGKNDLWIAATAKATGALLLTIDKDFDHLHPTIIKRNYLDPNNSSNWKVVR